MLEVGVSPQLLSTLLDIIRRRRGGAGGGMGDEAVGASKLKEARRGLDTCPFGQDTSTPRRLSLPCCRNCLPATFYLGYQYDEEASHSGRSSKSLSRFMLQKRAER